MEHKMLQDLVFIKYNQNLKEHYESDNVFGPIVVYDTYTCSEWLL